MEEKPLTPEELLEAVKHDPEIRKAIHANPQLVMDVRNGRDVNLANVEGDHRVTQVLRTMIGLREVFNALLREVSMIAVEGPGDPLDNDIDGQSPYDDFYRSLLANEATRRILREHVGKMIWIDTESQQWVIGEGVEGADELIRRVKAETGKCDTSKFYSRSIGRLGMIG